MGSILHAREKHWGPGQSSSRELGGREGLRGVAEGSVSQCLQWGGSEESPGSAVLASRKGTLQSPLPAEWEGPRNSPFQFLPVPGGN